MAEKPLWHDHPLCKSLIGRTFDRLTVEGPAERRYYLKCRCECGGTKEVSKYNLEDGQVRSCGCLRTEITKRLHTKTGHTANGKYSPERRAYDNMISRCHNPKTRNFSDYGGRGITVCHEWRGPGGFDRFLAHVGLRPSVKHTIERRNNDRGYYLGNVTWATRREQNTNRRNNRRLTFGRRTMTLVEWSEATGINAGTISHRLKTGWPVERALTEPVH